MLTVEEGLDASTISSLDDRGHPLNVVAPLEGPCSVACIRALTTGTGRSFIAGSDPRRDGWAAAY
jgi:gamma-glutamyltranspeptidase/glutathione hydrolase